MLVIKTNSLAGPPPEPRRGVVLLLVLAMLSIVALLGVTFATMSGQAQISGRYYASGRNLTTPDTYFDYAMSQLINDTSNIKSGIRGHSILRDAYGNDAADTGYFPTLPNGVPIQIVLTATANVYQTNIPWDSQAGSPIFGRRLTRWIIQLPSFNGVPLGVPSTGAQSLQVLADTNNGGYHQLLLSTPITSPLLTQPQQGVPLIVSLDGRYRNAFNGSGVAASRVTSGTSASGLADPGLPNYLFNGVGKSFANMSTPGLAGPIGSPSAMGMDEDYDAPDLENWFLGVQSADGRGITLPSFYRPGIVSPGDWTQSLSAYTNANGTLDWTNPAVLTALQSKAKFLRPRRIDHPDSGNSFPDLTPNAGGTIDYDIDNDGDGVTDSVWVDLGFPIQRSPDGKLFKPLFAFMVLGLNGRMPLNTVGNLAARSYIDDSTTDVNEFGQPLFDHASHKGTSPSEINPKFAFREQALYNQNNYFDLEMHRKLLSGDFASRTATGLGVGPTPGRFGEEGLLDPNPTNGVPFIYSNLNPQSVALTYPGYAIRPGWSTPVLQPYGANPIAIGPYYDDNFNSTDFTNLPTDTYPEDSDLTDYLNALQFAAERQRYGVLPIDPFGTGRTMAFNELPDNQHIFGPLFDYGHGADSKGRFGYFLHYRPPGFAPGINSLADLVANPYISHNLYHGFESYRDPIPPDYVAPTGAPYPSVWHRSLFAGAPYQLNDGITVPTYDAFSVGYPYATTLPAVPAAAPTTPDPTSYLPGGSLAWGEADQLNLYKPSTHDAPYSALDLEWLYRGNDPDFSTLDSRLGKLGPFYTDANGIVHRYFDPTTPQHNRLFSIDSWDLTNYAMAVDNPGNAFVNNRRSNKTSDNASFNLPIGNAAPPALLMRGRKINLNYPFGKQTSVRDASRLRWIDTTYQMLKSVLPPKALDHPEELARLGQFVVNIVDFRDTDAVMTIWTNPDVRLTAASATASPRAVFYNDAAAAQDLIHIGMEFQPIAITEVLAYSFKRKPSAGTQLYTQTPRFFIEFTNMLTRNGAYPDTNNVAQDTLSDLDFRNCDIVVTREDAQSTGWARPNPLTGQLAFTWTAPNQPVGPQWARIAKLTPAANQGAANKLKALTANGTTDPDVFGLGLSQSVAPNTIEVTNASAAWPPATASVTTLKTANYVDMTDATAATDIILPPTPAVEGGSKGAFHWVYLRRPANPDPNVPIQEDPALPGYNPLVVIDSMRFPYVEAGGQVTQSGNQVAVTQGQQGIWSSQRIQPYRGGQAIPNDATTPPSASYSPATAYGYTEQVDNGSGGQANSRGYGIYDPTKKYVLNPGTPTNNNVVTQAIYSTLGNNNRKNESWDPFVFLDRDFESVIELMLVPTCAPGLFTKQFVENPPPFDLTLVAGMVYPNGPLLPSPTATGYNTNPIAFPYRAPSTSVTPPGGGTAPGTYEEGQRLTSANGMHVYPFLADNFFYSADGTIATDGVYPLPYLPAVNALAVADGPTGAGWHRMLGFFEVPTNAMGGIGPVNQGVNLDWYRADTRPGLINPNLLADEQAFFGWLDDPRMNYASTSTTTVGPPRVAVQALPLVSTNASSTGFYYSDPVGTAFGNPIVPHSLPKGAWLDFLAARNAYFTTGTTVTPLLFSTTAEQPFHDITYPDINYTLLRPAGRRNTANNAVLDTLGNPLATKLNYPTDVLLAPQVPPRRLFELPSLEMARIGGTLAIRPAATEINLFDQVLASANTTLSQYFTMFDPGNYDITRIFRYMLGANRYAVNTNNDPNFTGQDDRRQHPAHRIELLSKLMNLTTVRTHQYAAWVTVGFFEVTQEGNSEKAAQLGNPDLAYDRLGKELGRDEGKAVRYRSFFVLDRTRATGFNSSDPDDFRNVIVYEKRIE